MLSVGRSRRGGARLALPSTEGGSVPMTQRTIASSGLTTTERFPCLARRRSTVRAVPLQRPARHALDTLADALDRHHLYDATPRQTPPGDRPARRCTADQHAVELTANPAAQALLRHRIDGPDRYEVGAMGPDDATDPTQRPSAEIIELVGVYHGSYGCRPGCAPRTGRAGGVPRDPAGLRSEMDRAAEALGADLATVTPPIRQRAGTND
jgi:hypothetical protein